MYNVAAVITLRERERWLIQAAGFRSMCCVFIFYDDHSRTRGGKTAPRQALTRYVRSLSGVCFKHGE